MIFRMMFLLLVQSDQAAAEAPASSTEGRQVLSESQQIPQTSEMTTEEVDRKIIYQKDQVVNLEGSQVEGENQLPPAFFVTKMQTPGARSLLEERLNFGFRDYNHMGF